MQLKLVWPKKGFYWSSGQEILGVQSVRHQEIQSLKQYISTWASSLHLLVIVFSLLTFLSVRLRLCSDKLMRTAPGSNPSFPISPAKEKLYLKHFSDKSPRFESHWIQSDHVSILNQSLCSGI